MRLLLWALGGICVRGNLPSKALRSMVAAEISKKLSALPGFSTQSGHAWEELKKGILEEGCALIWKVLKSKVSIFKTGFFS
ncbi:MAG: hypothetical protein MRJ65_14635 [Candidatus Brocadiaceae bacterium]|nr:hypothetical protein [Candidatus Brocadiaceae bacterium]